MEFTKNLIELRKSEPKFRYADFESIEKNIELLTTDKEIDLFIAYQNDNYVVIVNASKEKRNLALTGSYEVLVDADRVDAKGIKDYKYIPFEKDGVFIEPLSAILLKKKEI